jgi:hypothetical protein
LIWKKRKCRDRLEDRPWGAAGHPTRWRAGAITNWARAEAFNNLNPGIGIASESIGQYP